MSDSEVSVTKDGVTLKGGAAEDVRPLVRRVTGIADSALRLAGNLASLPLDYLSNNLERVRLKYAERLREIPIERQQEPPPRIAWEVGRQAAVSADEADVQDMFAKLLASASDSASADKVHPAFASVIADLRATDARVLQELAARQDQYSQFSPNNLRITGVKPDDVEKAIANFVRLGLMRWEARKFSERDLKRFAEADILRISQAYDVHDLQRRVEAEVTKLKMEVLKHFHWQMQQQVLRITEFGQSFIDVAVDKGVVSVVVAASGEVPEARL